MWTEQHGEPHYGGLMRRFFTAHLKDPGLYVCLENSNKDKHRTLNMNIRVELHLRHLTEHMYNQVLQQ